MKKRHGFWWHIVETVKWWFRPTVRPEREQKERRREAWRSVLHNVNRHKELTNEDEIDYRR
jgi:hypothetical protein